MEYLPVRLLEAEADFSIEYSNGNVKNSVAKLEEIPEKDKDISSEETSDEEMSETVTTVDETSSTDEDYSEEDMSSETVSEREEDDNPQERYLSDAMPPKNKTAWIFRICQNQVITMGPSLQLEFSTFFLMMMLSV